MHLCLDLSLKNTGYSIFSKNGSLLEKNSIIPAKELSNSFKIHYIVSRIEGLYNNITDLVIEDLYYGTNFAGIRELARLSGAVVYSWVKNKYKEPNFYMASTARKLVGINGRSHKAEVQLFVLEKYKFISSDKIEKYKEEYDELIEEFPIIPARKGVTVEERKKSKKNKGKLDYRLNKLSNKIWEETGIGEDIADSIVLGLAFVEDCKNEKS
jgi:Holliday junction resolvasome RuvABC endonuclease subunit